MNPTQTEICPGQVVWWTIPWWQVASGRWRLWTTYPLLPIDSKRANGCFIFRKNKKGKIVTERPVYLLMERRRMEWSVCFLVGWSQALELYAGLAFGLDLAHTKLWNLLFVHLMVLFQNHVYQMMHCSSTVLGVGWSAPLVGVLHYFDWLYW